MFQLDTTWLKQYFCSGSSSTSPIQTSENWV